jgi:hypothetical protein
MDTNSIFKNPFLIERNSYPNHASLKHSINERLVSYVQPNFKFYGTGYSTVSVKNEWLLNSHFSNFIVQKANDLTKANMQMSKIWVNINPEGAFQQRHMHPEYDIAGTYYIFCPITSGDITFYNPSPVVEAFQVLRPFYQFTHTHTPVEGDLLLWPGYIQHEVSYNYSNAVRISISFCLTAISKTQIKEISNPYRSTP